MIDRYSYSIFEHHKKIEKLGGRDTRPFGRGGGLRVVHT